ncbi:SRR1-like protein [Plasmodium berghei]|uniref:SRR1-like protein n=2 Tax=Plasmodium berghei TaxID=5821 RepID=A0A509AEW2_PLABA|nr:SRR1-like protein [Plasmodium berghei ANKA]CXH94917.1 SRR1-like protein [Plasmodium berghei]SCL90969.1 SRR1-like protein [Plasmodium berghei]SCM15395.1 SRR1-like protein [Plasmodium berghei]SCM17189.1 SRR1-like protein [Plasmodium berghei]SCN22234.1 SRR1-like protein [Plasmodium berghei]|eukprot:XP_034419979.1 SRR1-like protein [Plasmodium berghei ANKA]
MDGWINVPQKHKTKNKKYIWIKNEAKPDLNKDRLDAKNTTNGINEIYEKKKKKNDENKYVEHIHNGVKKIMNSIEKSVFFENFKKKFKEIKKESIVIQSAICLGLGSLTDINLNNKNACMYQLAFIILVSNNYNIKHIYIYDPKISNTDLNVYKILNVQVLSSYPSMSKQLAENEKEITVCNLKENENVLLYMPHCDISLYGEVLYNIFIDEKLSYPNMNFLLTPEKTIYIGNSFDYYKDHIYQYKPLGIPSFAIELLQKSEPETIKWDITHLNKMKKNFKYSHFIFYILNFLNEIKFPICSEQVHAFNDLSIITFQKLPDQFIFWFNIYNSLLAHTTGKKNE